eukprot:TRINITY_DN98_c0_g1_i5.p1 TRINITY_DN98_c0_g1~~TRINITY_DN98_c0_g1_i5.p1  ORF type:complete len:338 (-),score=41.11 TRINITY_DN98_c0_g1_i5:103-1116(-)
MAEELVKLGFVEEVEDKRYLLRHRFPSKMGGRPAWLNPMGVPFHNLTEHCAESGKETPMLFLLQLYAPLPTQHVAHQSAFHRSIFVFVSQKGGDFGKDGGVGKVKAFRCQLPRLNPWYSDQPPQDLPLDAYPLQLKEDDLKYVTRLDPWVVCGWEQSLDDKSFNPCCELLPEYELVVDYEDQYTPKDDEYIQQLLDQYNNSDLKDAEVPEDVLTSVQHTLTPEQQQFADFQARIEDAKDQVIRYCFSSNAKPLLPNTTSLPDSIPPCPLCQAPRIFEFQIMPQLIHFCGQPADHPNAQNWGTIIIYTCQNSCRLELSNDQDGGTAYAEEFVFVQSAP